MSEISNNSEIHYPGDHRPVVYNLSSLSHEITGRIGQEHTKENGQTIVRAKWSNRDMTRDYELWSHTISYSEPYTLDIKETTGSGLMRCTYGEISRIVISNPLSDYGDLIHQNEQHKAIQDALCTGPVPDAVPVDTETNKNNTGTYWQLAGNLTIAYLLDHPTASNYIDAFDTTKDIESLDEIYTQLNDISRKSGIYVNSHRLKLALGDEMQRRGLTRRQLPPATRQDPQDI